MEQPDLTATMTNAELQKCIKSSEPASEVQWRYIELLRERIGHDELLRWLHTNKDELNIKFV